MLHQEHLCKSREGLFLETPMNSHKPVLCSLLSMSLGTGLKNRGETWREGGRGKRLPEAVSAAAPPKAGVLPWLQDARVLPHQEARAGT